MKGNHCLNYFFVALIGLIVGPAAVYAVEKNPKTEPDFRKGETTGERYAGKGCWTYFNIGPVGARGELWESSDRFMCRAGGTQGRTTRVMQVLERTPADGIFKSHTK